MLDCLQMGKNADLDVSEDFQLFGLPDINEKMQILGSH